MTARLDLFAPATITALAGGVTSLIFQPPSGIFVQDPGSGEIALTITATNAATSFAASNASGATISSHANTLVIAGAAAQLNAALQTLQIFEPASATADTLSLVATEPGELATTTAIAIAIASTIGPAFVSPPQILAAAAYSLDTIPLQIGDPEAQSLIAAGLGPTETMQVTISVVSGLLLLPSLTPQPGITTTGDGSGALLLTFTADELAAVNALLSQLTYIGPTATSALFYQFSDITGPLPPASTSGNLELIINPNPNGPAIATFGVDTIIAGPASFALGQTLAVTTLTSALGGITGEPAVNILPDAAFEIPYNTINLGGTSTDDGTLAVLNLRLAGTLIAPGDIIAGGTVNISTGGFIDFANTLAVGTLALTASQPALLLAAGAEVTGSGTILAGNFSNAAGIFGPGTLLAAGGETLAIVAAEIGGGAQIQIGAGAALSLAAVPPLFGIFNPTPLTIDASDTITFLAQAGPAEFSGGYNDSLDQRGGILIIDSPADILGTLENFDPGDRLIFPGLSNLALAGVGGQSFVITGTDSSGAIQRFTINSSEPAGTNVHVGTDANGDGEISVIDTKTDIFLGSLAAAAATITAQPGYQQPLIGLTALIPIWTNQTLQLKLSVAAGTLSDGTIIPGATITLTATSPEALNAELAGLQYTASGVQSTDTLLITGAGYLGNVTTAIPITVTFAPGTISNTLGDAAELSVFSGSPPLIQTLGAPGAILVTGDAIFASSLNVSGLAGTALVVDAGGTAILDGAANAYFQGNVTIGDATGSGTLQAFAPNDNIIGTLFIGGNAAAAGARAVFANTIGLSAGMIIGGAATASVDLQSALIENFVSIGAAGTLALTGTAGAALGTITDAGTITFADQARANAPSAYVPGTLLLDGTSQFFDTGNFTGGGLVEVAQDALLFTGGYTQGGAGLVVQGVVTAASFLGLGTAIQLQGGTLIAQNITLSGGNFTGSGVIEGPGTLASLTLAGAQIIDTGRINIAADISMTAGAQIFIGPSAALELDHAIGGGTIDFTGAGGDSILTIDDAQKFQGAVGGMYYSDVIDLAGITTGEVTANANIITITDDNGALIDSFSITTIFGATPLSLVSDGHGGTLITVNGQLPCFVRGTRLLTPEGYRPIESFSPGDPVITRDGRPRAISWIGHRTMDLRGGTPDHPVRFDTGSISPGIPARPVHLSPLHAVFIDGVLIPALHLVNGATITWQNTGPVTYFHIELDRHDIVFAESMPVETFLENGNREALYEERGTRTHCATPCAPLTTTGPQLAKIRRRLHAIALAAGFTLTYDPALRGAAAQTALLPRITQKRHQRQARFILPPAADKLTLAARHATPADTDPDSEDRRQLAICLAALPPGATLGAGWLPRAPADEGVWMPGGAELLIPPNATTLVLSLAAVVRSWKPPCRR